MTDAKRSAGSNEGENILRQTNKNHSFNRAQLRRGDWSSPTVMLKDQPIDRGSHEWIDRRSLAMGKAIAAKLRVQPSLLQIAKDNLDRWMADMEPEVPLVLREWDSIVTQWPLEKILDILTSYDEEARRLRQSNPFPGVLTQEERLAIFREYAEASA